MHNLKKYYFINQYNPKILNKLNRNICLIWRSKYKDDKIDEIIYSDYRTQRSEHR